jgi:glycosyl hydrolase family 12
LLSCIVRLRIYSAARRVIVRSRQLTTGLSTEEARVANRILRCSSLITAAAISVLALPALPALGSVAAPAVATRAFVHRPRDVRICRQIGSMIVHGKHGTAYLLRNDNFGGRAECILNRNRWANFAVTRSAADSFGAESQAYPELQLGCAWNACTPGSGLPRRVDRLRHPTSTWHITTRTSGRWNAGYDMWFSRREHTNGQDRGAEIMVWINTSFGRPGTANVVWIGGFRYYFEHWVTHNALTGASWNLVIFRRYNATDRADRLRLLPFLRLAERSGLLSRHWWLTSIDSGFEIWNGGRGLGTRYYWAHV